MLRWWTAYEQTLLARLIRFPLSTTPRERMLTLSAIRLGALAGAVMLVAASALLTLVIVLGTILIIVYGD